MKQGTNLKRSRGRGGRKPGGSSRQHVFDSNGPSVRIRGSAMQIYEKYSQLARDNMANDRVASENMAQHAEHYFRVAQQQLQQQQQHQQQQHGHNNGANNGVQNGQHPNQPQHGSDGHNSGGQNASGQGSGGQGSGGQGAGGQNSDGQNSGNPPREASREGQDDQPARSNGAAVDGVDADAAADTDNGADQPEQPARRPRRPRTRAAKSPAPRAAGDTSDSDGEA